MDKTEQLVAKTEKLMKQIETLQVAVQQLNGELAKHREELSQQLDRLKKKPASPPLRALMTPERRVAPRRKGNPVSVYINNGAAEDEAVQGWVVDRSAGGLKLLVDEAVAPGTLLNVRPVKVHANFPWVQVKVKSCYPERKSWNLGCQFLHKVAWDDLQQFG